MNFFDAQTNARKATRRLVIVYVLATAIIVAAVTLLVSVAISGAAMTTTGTLVPQSTPLLVSIALGTTLLILGASLVKTANLSSGGRKVALSMGGVAVSSDTSDPLRRRLRNVVEEMAIASGVPMPDLFVLEEEPGINAFAAGYTPSDAAVAVTRGALETLSREELQGVIAHEFSHILNGDMRLNIRMMGVLYGIMVIGLLGRLLLRSGHYGALSSRRNKNGSALILIGLGLAIVGWIGVFFSRLIKAAVSRQREFLADASAVQFTRETRGIANALKKIGGYSESSLIKMRDPEEVSHMLFGTGAKFSSIFATHPPLVKRIQALDPAFTKDAFPEVKRQDGLADIDERIQNFAGAAAPSVDTVVDLVGQPQPEHVAIARALRAEIPPGLYDAAHSTDLSYLLCIALFLDTNDASDERQMAVVVEQMGQRRAELIRSMAREIAAQPSSIRLPILEIAFPALKRRPLPQIEFLLKVVRRMVVANQMTSLRDFCFYRILRTSFADVSDPSARQRTQKINRTDVQNAAIDALQIIARAGNDSEAAAEAAFKAGVAVLPNWRERAVFAPPPRDVAATLERALDHLLAVNSEGLELLMRALTATVTHDEELTVDEEVLLRAVSASLHCPLPPTRIGQ